jgi:hypothetical protein
MAEKPPITPLQSTTNLNTLIPAINANLDSLKEKFNDVLSRKGDIPNAMEAVLDMNSNDIINVRKIFAEDLALNGRSAGLREYAERAEAAATQLGAMAGTAAYTFKITGPDLRGPYLINEPFGSIGTASLHIGGVFVPPHLYSYEPGYITFAFDPIEGEDVYVQFSVTPIGVGVGAPEGPLTALDSIDPAWKRAALDWIISLRVAGVWGKIAAAWLPCLGPVAGRVNVKAPALYELQPVGTVHFIPGLGAFTPHTAGYLDTGFVPSGQMQPDDYHAFVALPASLRVTGIEHEGTVVPTWGRPGSNFRPMIGAETAELRVVPMGVDHAIRVADGAGGFVSIGADQSVLQHVGTTLVCSDGVDFTGYKGGALTGTAAVAAAALPTTPLWLLRSQDLYGDHPLAVATVGSALTASEAEALHSATIQFMLAVGAWEAPRDVPKVDAPSRIRPQRAPVRVVDFQTGEGLSDFVYTRAGTTSVLNQNGHFVSVAENALPIYHDPLTGRRMGLQTYAPFQNQEANPQLPTDSSYVKSAMTVGTATGVIGLDGSTSGVFTLTADGTEAEHSISRTYASAERYLCAQVWLRLPSAVARAKNLIALRIRSKDGEENWVVVNNSNRQVVTHGPNFVTLAGTPRAGIIQTADERYQIYGAVDLTTAATEDARVSVVVIGGTYPMDGSDPAPFAVNERTDVTNLLGWQVTWNNTAALDAYPRPFVASGAVAGHSGYIDLTGLPTGGDLFCVIEADLQFMGPLFSTVARWQNGGTFVANMNATSSGSPNVITSTWSGASTFNLMLGLFDGASFVASQGRSVAQGRQYVASSWRAPASGTVTAFTGGNPDRLYIGHGGTIAGRHLAMVVKRVEVYTSRPQVSELREMTQFQGGLYAPAPFINLTKSDWFGLFQPFLGARRYDNGTHPWIERALQSAYNSAGTILSGDGTAYCAAWVNYMLELIGMRVPAALWAADYIGLGVPILDSANWKTGDVVLITYNGNEEEDEADRVGHVALFWERIGDFVVVLGGNHNGSQVGFAVYPMTNIFGARRLTTEYAQ